MPLFKITDNKVTKLQYKGFNKERQVQQLFENNMTEMLGMNFLKSEYSTLNGRIDSLALDESGNPVIFEYKLTKDENVLSQGLFYMDWLVNHKGDFEMLVQKTLGANVKVVWSSPKLVIVASDFSRYDKYAVNVVNRDISLYKYYFYDDDMLYFERINTDKIDEPEKTSISTPVLTKKIAAENTLEALQHSSSSEAIEIYNEIKERILALDDSISEKITSIYVAYRTSKNFVEIYFRKTSIQCILLSPENDKKNIGRKLPESYNWTLNYRVDVKNQEDIDDVMELIEESYNKTK
ncbi:MAG: DUF5655 domain-containing protein [Desulfosporosinus sp.]